MNIRTRIPVVASLSLALVGALSAQDAERATHTDDAARPQVAMRIDEPDLVLRQYQLGCLSLLSYLVVVDGEAAVIDPQRDVEHYLADAKALGAKLRWIVLTHPHADFVAGHTELAQATGAEIALAAAAHAGFAHHALQDGERIALGGAQLTMWLTPGHTPDSSVFLLTRKGQSAPSLAFTGDTLFVGGIGRPDLLDVPPAQLASQSFDSVQRLKGLADAVQVLPAHGAGSLCGAHLSPETTSTIGRERQSNPYLAFTSRASFVANVISHQPIAPQYFGFNVGLNRKGPPLVAREQAAPPLLSPQQTRDVLAAGGFVVDLREARDYAAAHVPGSVNIGLHGRLDTWMGIVVAPTAPLVLVGSAEEVQQGAFRLRRIGYDQLAGQLAGGIDAWRAAGLEVRQSKLVTPAELAAAMRAGKEPIVVDVRTRDEYEDLRLGDVGNIPVTESERFAKSLDKQAPVVFSCNSAYRSSMAVGLAERLGFADVASLDGGLDAWVAAGLPTIGRMAVGKVAAPAAATAAANAPQGASLRLPEPIEPSALARVLVDQPQAYALFDLRPAWQFAEWHVPGSANAAIDELAAKLAAVPAGQRIVLLDRDGTTAFAVAGALLARAPERDLRVLVGGLQRFWRETAFASGGVGGGANAAAPAATPANPAAPAATTKKRNAGC